MTRDERIAERHRRAAAALIRAMDSRDQAAAEALAARHVATGDVDAVAAWVWRIEAERAAYRRVHRPSAGWRLTRHRAA